MVVGNLDNESVEVHGVRGEVHGQQGGGLGLAALMLIFIAVSIILLFKKWLWLNIIVYQEYCVNLFDSMDF